MHAAPVQLKSEILSLYDVEKYVQELQRVGGPI